MMSNITIGDKSCTFEINAIICDAPARAFVTGTKSHTGYFGCGKCTQEGDYIDHRIVYTETNNILRSDDTFRLRQQPEHHIRSSILENLKIGMVSQVPNDYLHLVCLGVLKKLISFWVRGKKDVRLREAGTVSLKLTQSSVDIPSEFCRKPRSMFDIDRWKDMS